MKPRVSVYVRDFSWKTYRIEEIPIIKWFPLIKSLRNDRNNIRDDDYIIGPWYTSGDLQIGVTGGVLIRESPEKGASRELGEEIGLVPRELGVMQKAGIYKYGKKTIYTYKLYFGDTTPVLDSQNGVKISENKDSRATKAGVLVYGSRKQIRSFLERECIYVYHSEDRIKGVGAIKVKDILNLIRTHRSYFSPKLN